MERVLVGAFMTALDMAGLSLSVLVLDAQRLARLDAPTLVRARARRAPRSACMQWVPRAMIEGQTEEPHGAQQGVAAPYSLWRPKSAGVLEMLRHAASYLSCRGALLHGRDSSRMRCAPA